MVCISSPWEGDLDSALVWLLPILLYNISILPSILRSLSESSIFLSFSIYYCFILTLSKEQVKQFLWHFVYGLGPYLAILRVTPDSAESSGLGYDLGFYRMLKNLEVIQQCTLPTVLSLRPLNNCDKLNKLWEFCTTIYIYEIKTLHCVVFHLSQMLTLFLRYFAVISEHKYLVKVKKHNERL